MSDFAKALKQVLEWEVEYDAKGNVRWENVPGDTGGVTKYGVDQASHPNVDIKNLTYEGAATIYKNDYWNKIRGDDLPWPVNAVTFDIAVNNGVSRAVKWLQEVLAVTVDGRIGPKTIKSAQDCEPESTALRLINRREGFYRQIAKQPSKKKFLAGWLNRNNDLADFIA